MIKLLDDKRIEWDAIKTKHLQTFKESCLTLLRRPTSLRPIETRFNNYLIGQLSSDVLLTGTPDEVRAVRAVFLSFQEKGLSFDTIVEGEKKKTSYHSFLFTVFNYDDFRGSYLSSSRWGAYEFLKMLGVKTCLYCNRNYTVVYDRSYETGTNAAGKVRPVLDHLFMRSRYPFLGLALFNLVPSCYECNTCLKGSHIKLEEEDHLNPYSESFHAAYQFVADLDVSKMNDVGWESTSEDSFSIALESLDTDKTSANYNRASLNKQIFALAELYNCHKEVILPILYNTWRYGYGRLEELEEKAIGLKLPPTDWKRLVFGSFMQNVADIKLKPFSKITYDISKRYKII